jgi:hypothetical protein
MRFAQAGQSIACGSHLDEALETVDAGAAVFAIYPAEGKPYLGRTSVLNRRLKRLLKARENAGRSLNLRSIADRIEYWPTASRLESALVLYELAREHLPERYLEFLKLRMPPYVKLVLGNDFPRTQVTTRITPGAGQYYGPFRTRAAAEQFEHELLDLFQLRRCQEDLVPSPDHPGCIYGEMNMCLRPCQQVVSVSEYASEAARISEFLRTNGSGALQAAESSRDRMSAELEFEEAARQHRRVERIQEVLKLRDELVRDMGQLCGVAVTQSTHTGAVALWFLLHGVWQPPVLFDVTNADQSVSMDRRLRDLAGSLAVPPDSQRARQEHLAILARWFYSSWRDGSWIGFDRLERVPFRRIVSAISRTVHQSPFSASH